MHNYLSGYVPKYISLASHCQLTFSDLRLKCRVGFPENRELGEFQESWKREGSEKGLDSPSGSGQGDN